MSTAGLADLLSEMWDRSQRIFPTSRTTTSVLRWLLEHEQILESDIVSTDDVPYPAQWCESEGTFSDTVNIRWGAGGWG
jgi:hypothetical protein